MALSIKSNLIYFILRSCLRSNVLVEHSYRSSFPIAVRTIVAGASENAALLHVS